MPAKNYARLSWGETLKVFQKGKDSKDISYAWPLGRMFRNATLKHYLGNSGKAPDVPNDLLS